jgi:hypothetical protein
MRSFVIPLAALAFLAAPSMALAKVSITVDKDNQMMTVAVDGVERYHWPVSTGNPSHETPNGTFRTFRMEADHFSKEFDDAPMPHSIFFTKVGHAIHGTFSERSLGLPVSHGCVRISRANATTLWDLVKKEGLLNTTVTLTGSSEVALARKGKATTAVARRAPLPTDSGRVYDAAGKPIDLTPHPASSQPDRGQVFPQQADSDDQDYIYPADGSTSDRRYPSPRPYRRAQQVQRDYNYGSPYEDSRAYAPQGYYAPQPAYRPRGLFTDWD